MIKPVLDYSWFGQEIESAFGMNEFERNQLECDLPGTGGMWFSIVLLTLAILLFIIRGLGPDRDNDGMGDAYEALLGLDDVAHTSAVAGEEE